jgi:hypothetical protein
MMATGTESREGRPWTMTRTEALDYCRNVLGWKNAYLPGTKQEDEGFVDSQTVYERKPENLFDTPQEFYFTLA